MSDEEKEAGPMPGAAPHPFERGPGGDPRCDECDPSYGCFDGSAPCSKAAPGSSGAYRDLVNAIDDRLRKHASNLESDHPDSAFMRERAQAFLDAADMVLDVAKEKKP